MHGSQYASQALQRLLSTPAVLSLNFSHQQVCHCHICCPCFSILQSAFRTCTAAMAAPEQLCHFITLVGSLPARPYEGILAMASQV